MNTKKMAVAFLFVLVAVALFLMMRDRHPSLPETALDKPNEVNSSATLPVSVEKAQESQPAQSASQNANQGADQTANPTSEASTPPPAAPTQVAKPDVFIPTKRAGRQKPASADGFSIPTKGRQSKPIGHYGDAAPVRVKSKDELDRAKPKSYSGNPEDLLIEGEKKLSRPQD